MDNGLSVSRWRHVIKTVAVPLLHRSGALWLSNRLKPGQRRIALNYHNVEARIFESHAAFLKQSADVVDIDTFLSCRPAGNRARPLVTITFDDGYVSFVQSIVPILARFGLSATWFVPTALVGTGELFWFDRIRAAVLCSARRRLVFQGRQWRLQSWNREYVAAAVSKRIKQSNDSERTVLVAHLLKELGEAPAAYLRKFQPVSQEHLRSLDPDCIALGSHSHTHPQLSQLGDTALAFELTTSKRLLEQWSGRAVRHFAYPSGDYDAPVIRAIRQAGYVSAWTTEPRFVPLDADPYQLPRIPIDDHASGSILSAKMTPWVHRWAGQ